MNSEYKKMMMKFLDLRLMPFVKYVVYQPANFLGVSSLAFLDDDNRTIRKIDVDETDPKLMSRFQSFNNNLIAFAQDRINYLIYLEKEKKDFLVFLESGKLVESKIIDIVKEENVYLQYKRDVIDFIKNWDFYEKI